MLSDHSRPHSHDRMKREAVKQLLSQLDEDGQQKAGRLSGDELKKLYDELNLYTASFYKGRIEAAIKAKFGGQLSPPGIFINLSPLPYGMFLFQAASVEDTSWVYLPGTIPTLYIQFPCMQPACCLSGKTS